MEENNKQWNHHGERIKNERPLKNNISTRMPILVFW